MDSNRIKNLAYGARSALMSEMSSRLDVILAEGSPERLSDPLRVATIERRVQERGRDGVVEAAAYNWFNRLCALRFMDSNGYTPVGVVTPRDGETLPEILSDAMRGFYDPELGISSSLRDRVSGLLSGSLPSASPQDDAYMLLLRASCDHYAEAMGFLFGDGVSDGMLVPQGLLAEGSIMRRIVSGMDDEACKDVEVLGWLYQFYVAERKKEYFDSKRKATAEDIAPATQIFTPDWIVRYLVENSVGRTWMLSWPESNLKESMEYYMAPTTVSSTSMTVGAAEDITVLDPACGSGHILVYAFDLLYRMYEEEGWPEEDIPSMIIKNNLFGLEIDQRAAEIALFALDMKARAHDQSWLSRGVSAHITVLEPVRFGPGEIAESQLTLEMDDLLKAFDHLDEIGSLYKPTPDDRLAVETLRSEIASSHGLMAKATLDKLDRILQLIDELSRTYVCVVTNPPYMGSNNMNPWLSGWIKAHYPDEKSDLCTCFINRCGLFSGTDGYVGMITASSWMFISSFEKMRRKLLSSWSIKSMIQQSTHGFPSVTVPTTMFVLQNGTEDKTGSYIRLEDFDRPQWQQPYAYNAIHDHDCGYYFEANAEDYEKIKWVPIAYWSSKEVIDAFYRSKTISDYAQPRQGLATGDNKRFIREWWEVPFGNIGFGMANRDDAKASHKRWFPCNKGGSFRKWYGNNWLVVNWENDGYELRHFTGSNGKLLSRPQNIDYYFRPGITWGAISSSDLSMRYSFAGAISETKGAMCFAENDDTLVYLLALTNSSLSKSFFSVLSPTLDYHEGPMGKFPVIFGEEEIVLPLARENIRLSKEDWDSLETSWGFVRHPMTNLPEGLPALVSDGYNRWALEREERFCRLKSNEERLNQAFARAYNMEGQVPIEVPDEKVSVQRADLKRDIKSLISYGVGCIMGRFSLEGGGIAIADQGLTAEDYCSWMRQAGETLFFVPDADGILPITEGEWFDDDIVTEFHRWLGIAYGVETLDDNLRFIENALGKTLREYFFQDFYTDHCSTYSVVNHGKRPVYWLFSSPKGSFNALVYAHRMDEGTVGDVLTGYVRPYRESIGRQADALDMSDRAADKRQADKLRAQVSELDQWEREVLYPLAQQRVTIDLNDGVKANYNKFPWALKKVQGLSDWK